MLKPGLKLWLKNTIIKTNYFYKEMKGKDMKWTNYLTMLIIFVSIYAFAGQKNDNKTKVKNESNSVCNNTSLAGLLPAVPVPRVLEKVLSLNKERIGNSGQIILVTNEYITQLNVKIQTFEKNNGKWVEKFAKTSGTIGFKGFAEYKQKREGDKKTPTGIFYLGPVYTYPNVKVETKMDHWVATKNDYWIDDVKSVQYNRWVTSEKDPKTDNVSCEPMLRKQDGKYKYGIAVQFNMDQVKGNGSVITVHVLEGPTGTVGCIAIPIESLIEIIGWLDPIQKPLIINGTQAELISKPVSVPGLDKNDIYIWKKEKYAPPSK